MTRDSKTSPVFSRRDLTCLLCQISPQGGVYNQPVLQLQLPRARRPGPERRQHPGTRLTRSSSQPIHAQGHSWMSHQLLCRGKTSLTTGASRRHTELTVSLENMKEHWAHGNLLSDKWTKVNGDEQLLPGLKYSQRQMFWLSAANVWCSKVGMEKMRRL